MSRMPSPLGSATCRRRCRIGDTTVPFPAGWKLRSARRWLACARATSRKADMIDPKLLRTDPEGVARNLARRGFRLDVAALRALEEKRKPWAVEVDRLRAERNANAKAVGVAKGRGEDGGALIAKGESLTVALTQAEAQLS